MPTSSIPISLDFVKSFINFYEISNEGRFTHEYHPFLLKKTAHSFSDLENILLESGFKTAHRMIIMGYEKAAAPDYFFNPFAVKGESINDETINKTLFGITQECHDLFGFMTGFLLKNLPTTPQMLTEHIGNKKIIIFDPRAYRFQQDFCGNLHNFFKQQEQQIHKALFDENHEQFMQTCIDFWNTLYYQNINNKDQHVAGTQDILFTIEHAQHIKDSPIPLKYFFTGSDVTYPINQTTLRSKKATENAQEFVATFSKKLQPINDEKTLYVFRSFVDGVGKSTMLGNIKNWMKYQNNIKKYQAIDNASSQFAEIFQFSEQVFIADLPAQLSHFTYKPDGSVFVNIKNLPDRAYEDHLIIEHFEKNKKQISDSLKNKIKEFESLSPKDLLSKQSDSQYNAYCKNLLLLNIKEIKQIPFLYKNQTFLLNPDTKEIRLCLPLGQAPSEGLKNSNPEQMIFNQGVRFPFEYQHFLDIFTEQCKETGATQIVFVDFLSMYARSSREVIRINYLIQQIQALFDQADYQKSLYAGFASNATLLHHFNQKINYLKISDCFFYETITRASLFNLIDSKIYNRPDPVELSELHNVLKQEIENQYLPQSKAIIQNIDKKLALTHTMLLEQYKDNKEFIHLLSPDLNQLLPLSSKIEKHMKQVSLSHQNPWKNIGEVVQERDICQIGECEKIVLMNNGTKMRALFVFDPQKCELSLRASLFVLLRKWWIPALISSIAVTDKNGRPSTKQFKYPVAPLLVKPGLNGLWYVLQKKLHTFENDGIEALEDLPNLKLLNKEPSTHTKYGCWNDNIYIKEWKCTDCSSGIYNWGYSLSLFNTSQNYPLLLDSAFSELIKPSIDAIDTSQTIRLSQAYKTLEQRDKYSFFSFCEKEIKKNLVNPSKESKNQKKKKSQASSRPEVKISSVNPSLIQWTKHACYLITQVARLVPHPQSSLALHLESKEDFFAGLMLTQKILLPEYGHVFFEEPLWSIAEISRLDLEEKS
ncbi:hypothetical protein JKY79_03485 [Candidatus Babeliales bacterium]|nr:hypothetical protein [Candidatus Babeliales bacterium]